MAKRTKPNYESVKSQVLYDYQNGKGTTGEIAKRNGISAATVTFWAKKAGVPLRNRGRWQLERPNSRQLEIIKLASKHKYREVGERYGMSRQAIHRITTYWADRFTPKIVCGDCLDVMRKMPSESVDMIFADYPFNVGIKYGVSNDRRPDYREWCAERIAEGFRLLKPTGSFYLMTLTRHLEWKMPIMGEHGIFVNLISWRNCTSAASPRCFRQEYQPIMLYGKTTNYKFHPYAQKEKPRFERWGKQRTPPKDQVKDRWSNIPRVNAGSTPHREAILIPGTNSKAHPTQMPLGLPIRAILFSTDVGDTVLDPFNGSGTTAEATRRLCRRYIGIDNNPDYLQLTQDRLVKVRLGRDL